MLEEEETYQIDNLNNLSNQIGLESDLNTISDINLNELKVVLSQKGILKPIVQIGAGLSRDYQLPSWNDLVLKILGHEKCLNFEPANNGALDIENEFKDLLKHLTSEQWISFAQKVIATNQFEEKIENIIKEILYPVGFEIDTELETVLNEIVEKWVNSNKISGFITYNYDNILELILNKKTVSNAAYSNLNIQKLDFNNLYPEKIINVFHVHGYIPISGEITSIILDEYSYFDQYSNPLNWQNIVQLKSLVRHNNIFFGISLNDLNMRRVLSQAKLLGGKKHFLITDKGDFINSDVKNAVNLIKIKYLETLNIGIIFVDNHKIESFSKIFE
jgi:SIR2-like domain